MKNTHAARPFGEAHHGGVTEPPRELPEHEERRCSHGIRRHSFRSHVGAPEFEEAEWEAPEFEELMCASEVTMYIARMEG